MAFENVKIARNGFELSCELKDMPVSFVNALRRILLGHLPVVVVRDVEIVENTTQLPHEMVRHRMEMLPVNVMPTESALIKDARLELRIQADKELTVTTDDFVVEGGRNEILMKDRDIGDPLLFLRLRKGESIHIRARLAVEHEQVSHVCTATTMWHIDPELAAKARKEFVEQGNDPRIFDNSLVQRYFSRNDAGRPNWIDLFIESVGVIRARDLLHMTLGVLRKQLDEYTKEALENIQREADAGTYTVSVEQGGHTIGYLMQEVMYSDENVQFVAYDIPHPLRSTMVLRFHTKRTPESVLKTANEVIKEYCSVVEKGL